MDESSGYSPKRLNWRLIALVTAGHLLALVGLTYAFAPDFTRMVVDRATSLVTVTVRTYEEPETVPAQPAPDEGAAAAEGPKAVPREVVAPEVPLPRASPAPRASSTGSANQSGAGEVGSGTGAGGEGSGTGSGRSGSGRGGIAVTRPSVRSGSIDAARDFPIPEGGREVRFGTSVTVVFTVNTDGTASDCTISAPGPDPATNALVCPLVIERIRFNPARDSDGNAVSARYGWRQDFIRR